MSAGLVASYDFLAFRGYPVGMRFDFARKAIVVERQKAFVLNRITNLSIHYVLSIFDDGPILASRL